LTGNEAREQDGQATSHKYEIPDDHEWTDQEEVDEDVLDRTSVDTHEVSVIYTVDPNEDMGYGREKYTAHLTHGKDRDPVALYVLESRWKGNYWREKTEWDWRDIPDPVKRRIADVVACNGAGSLRPQNRLIPEGGETAWQRRGDDGE